MVLALVASPVMSMISDVDGGNENYTITKMYVYDETGYFNEDTVVPMLKDGGWEVQVAQGAAPLDKEYEELCASKLDIEVSSFSITFPLISEWETFVTICADKSLRCSLSTPSTL